MSLRILCIGDVVGAPGRRLLQKAVPALVREGQIDCVIVNAENAAAGSGLTPPLSRKILDCGVDVITLGDHAYRRREIIGALEQSNQIIRPANFPTEAPGKDFVVFETASGGRVAVTCLLGRLFMKPLGNCPFAAIDRVLKAIPRDVRTIVVEMHAEATSEKIAMGWHLDGRASVVFGTHTHVATADERVLPKGTAYITDIGMTGPHDSVLGRRKEIVVATMTSGVANALPVATGDLRVCGVTVSVDAATGRATAIERVCYYGTEEPDES